jgi:hypothetical protein
MAAGALSPETLARTLGIVAGAIGVAACGLVRDAGRKLQPELWRSWGGSPSVRRLRWSENDVGRLQRLHERLSGLVGWTLPSREDELADANAADERYEEALGVVRSRTRDQSRFRLLFAENVDYGFRRNMLGVRTTALIIAVAALVTGVIAALLTDGAGWTRWAIAAGVSFGCGLYWWHVVTPDWVRRTAESYADRLLEAVDELAQPGE